MGDVVLLAQDWTGLEAPSLKIVCEQEAQVLAGCALSERVWPSAG